MYDSEISVLFLLWVKFEFLLRSNSWNIRLNLSSEDDKMQIVGLNVQQNMFALPPLDLRDVAMNN